MTKKIFSRNKTAVHKVSGYEDNYGLFIACTMTKTDDINFLLNKLDLRRLRSIRDFCGGFGRARLHWPSPIKDWAVFDASKAMRSAGRRLLSKHHIEQTRFIDFNLDAPQTITRVSPGDLSLLLYNSINELKSLDNCFGNIAQLTKSGGLLFVKSIALTDEQRMQTEIVTPIPLFVAFDNTLWRGRTISRRPGIRSSIQNVTIEFEQIGLGTKVSYTLRRTIWSVTEVDEYARRNGFSLKWRESDSGYALFEKSSSLKLT